MATNDSSPTGSSAARSSRPIDAPGTSTATCRQAARRCFGWCRCRRDANQHGDIFGGWIMSQVDIAGGVVAARRARGRVATVAVNSFLFKEPVMIGDRVSFYADVVRVGRTSITVNVEVLRGAQSRRTRGHRQGHRGDPDLCRHRRAAPAAIGTAPLRAGQGRIGRAS